MAKASEDGCAKFLCVVSCLWIIFYPIYLGMRKNLHNRIVAEYVCTGNGGVFFQRNYMSIIAGVVGRQQFTVAAA